MATYTDTKNENTLESTTASTTTDSSIVSSNDILKGLLGDDNYYIDSIKDVVTESANTKVINYGIDTIYFDSKFDIGTSKSYTLSANVENLNLQALDLSITLTESKLTALNKNKYIINGNALANTIYTSDSSADYIKIMAGSGDDTIYGRSGNDEIDGGVGNDNIIGGSGDDTLFGGADKLIDTMEGGDGIDTYMLRDLNDNIIDTSTSNKILLDKSFADKTLDLTAIYTNANITDVNASAVSKALTLMGNNDISTTISGGNGNDNIIGGSKSDILKGNNGNDLLNGGNDGSISDILIGGAGNDIYQIHDLHDVIQEYAKGGIDTIELLDNYSDNSSISLDTISINVENINCSAIGSDLSLTGSNITNIITCGDGNDSIDGGIDSFKDMLVGGNGSDTYIIHDVKDAIIENGANLGDIDTIKLSSDFSLNAYKLSNTNIEAIDASAVNKKLALTGNAKIATSIIGGSCDDIIKGGNGNDTLDGGEDNTKNTILIKSKSIYDSSTKITSKYTYTYDSNGNVLTEYYKEYEGKSLSYSYTNTYTYDNQANILTDNHVEYYSSGNIDYIYTQTYTYDSNGNNLTLYAEDVDSKGDISYSVLYTYTHDAQNRLTQYDYRTYGTAFGDKHQVSTYTYDTTGNIITLDRITYYNITTAQSRDIYTYTYDAAGNKLSEEWKWYIGLSEYREKYITNYTYDKNNNLLTESEISYNSSGKQTLEYLRAYTYDENGNNTSNEFTQYDSYGNIRCHLLWMFTYDSYGNMLKEGYISFDDSGDITDANVITYKYAYDTIGDSLYGGSGNDTYIIHDLNDTIIEKNNGGNDTIKLATDFENNSVSLTNISAYIENLDASSVALNLSLLGNELNNFITGGNGDDVITGRKGNDTLTGGLGADIYNFYEGDGKDLITSTDSSDIIDIGNNTGIIKSDMLFYTDASNNFYIDYTDSGVGADIIEISANNYDSSTTIQIGSSTIHINQILGQLSATGTANLSAEAISLLNTTTEATQYAALTTAWH